MNLHRKVCFKLYIIGIIVIIIITGCSNDYSYNSLKEESNKNVKQNGSEILINKKYDKPVTIGVVLGYSDSINPKTPKEVTPETATLIKLLKRDLNIEIKYKWIVSNDQYDAKFTAELEVGNLPDIVQVTKTQFQYLYEQGKLADLTNIYEKYCNETIKNITNYDNNIINTGMRGKKIYGLPNVQYSGQQLGQIYYRMDILQKAGIEKLPSTIKEFETVCDKLMKIDWDNDGIIGEPIIAASKDYENQLAGFVPFFMAYSTTTKGWYKNEKGVLEYGGINKELMKPLKKLNEWYTKGYIHSDFASFDSYTNMNNSNLIKGIINGDYPIVCGSWWVPNYPLNYNVNKTPQAKWVIGPILSEDGRLPEIFVPRYLIDTYTVVSKECDNPEAIFKIMNYTANYESKIYNPSYQKNMTEEEKIEYNSYVQNWLPWEVYMPTSIIDNYNAINTIIDKGLNEVPNDYIQSNTEFWKAWNSYNEYIKNPSNAISWGMYFSRIAPNGGVANMKYLFENAYINYDEVYTCTNTMIKKEKSLKKYQNYIFNKIIMGEVPIEFFDEYIYEWNIRGGNNIKDELNTWYQQLNKDVGV
ncbi:extracellular solute-binding protein [Vallitalea sp.]|jgi:ABC-type glycerol-3-phosphate transport system substrate-binding protein|uniref:extracellular solute-binding protein n=1 Tax=Vallitalea sp. TaxID=1882829 RepID=UPI0025CF91E0|nr:extracellular solute-binding protein [Vallitalea sp.]MCT4687845.1 extracellular solute-binding protein [Vallitalea sp.]